MSSVTICGSRVSGWMLTSLTSACGSSASTSVAPVATSIRMSLAVSAPTELVPSSELPSALNAIGSLVSASSAGMVSSARQSASRAVPDQERRWLPSGCGAAAALTASCASATQPMKPGLSTSLVSSPVARSSR